MPLIAQDSWVSRQLLDAEAPEEASDDNSMSSSAPVVHELSGGAAPGSCRAWRLGALLGTLGLAVAGVAMSRSMGSQRHSLRMPLQLYDTDEAWMCMELGNGLDAAWCASVDEQLWVRKEKGLTFRWFQDEFERGVSSPCGNCWCCFRDALGVQQAAVTPAPRALELPEAPLPAQAAVTPAPRSLELIEVQPASPVSLYCWSVIRTSGYEPALMSLQQSRGVGIFACEGHQVFSTTTGNVNGIATIGLGDDPTHMCNWENRVFYACNTKMFIKAWEKIVALGDYLQFTWTVKVDPDAGFFPERLKQRLPQVSGEQRLFVQNADFPKMLGPIEVVSQASVTRFGAARQECYDKFDEDVTGEDGYFSDCFSVVVGAEAHEDRGVLDNSGSAWNCGGGAACVHAFKDQGALAECYDHAR